MKQNELLYIVVSLFVIVVLWIGFNLFHTYASSTVTDTQTTQVTPITPIFQKEILTKIKARPKVEPLFDSDKVSASVSAVTPTPTKPGQSVKVTPTTPVAGSASSSASGGAKR
jgi:hypothetical protein